MSLYRRKKPINTSVFNETPVFESICTNENQNILKPSFITNVESVYTKDIPQQFCETKNNSCKPLENNRNKLQPLNNKLLEYHDTLNMNEDIDSSNVLLDLDDDSEVVPTNINLDRNSNDEKLSIFVVRTEEYKLNSTALLSTNTTALFNVNKLQPQPQQQPQQLTVANSQLRRSPRLRNLYSRRHVPHRVDYAVGDPINLTNTSSLSSLNTTLNTTSACVHTASATCVDEVASSGQHACLIDLDFDDSVSCHTSVNTPSGDTGEHSLHIHNCNLSQGDGETYLSLSNNPSPRPPILTLDDFPPLSPKKNGKDTANKNADNTPCLYDVVDQPFTQSYLHQSQDSKGMTRAMKQIREINRQLSKENSVVTHVGFTGIAHQLETPPIMVKVVDSLVLNTIHPRKHVHNNASSNQNKHVLKRQRSICVDDEEYTQRRRRLPKLPMLSQNNDIALMQDDMVLPTAVSETDSIVDMVALDYTENIILPTSGNVKSTFVTSTFVCHDGTLAATDTCQLQPYVPKAVSESLDLELDNIVKSLILDHASSQLSTSLVNAIRQCEALLSKQYLPPNYDGRSDDSTSLINAHNSKPRGSRERSKLLRMLVREREVFEALVECDSHEQLHPKVEDIDGGGFLEEAIDDVIEDYKKEDSSSYERVDEEVVFPASKDPLQPLCEPTILQNNIRYIAGYTVAFPPDKPPYPTQISYCSKLLTALSKQVNALLESPTGTGKSISMLVCTISYLTKEYTRMEREKNNVRMMHYTGNVYNEISNMEKSSYLSKFNPTSHVLQMSNDSDIGYDQREEIFEREIIDKKAYDSEVSAKFAHKKRTDQENDLRARLSADKTEASVLSADKTEASVLIHKSTLKNVGFVSMNTAIQREQQALMKPNSIGTNSNESNDFPQQKKDEVVVPMNKSSLYSRKKPNEGDYNTVTKSISDKMVENDVMHAASEIHSEKPSGNYKAQSKQQSRFKAAKDDLVCDSKKSPPIPRVIIASRTHTQIAQLVNTLKSLSSPAFVTTCVLGSRSMLCTNKDNKARKLFKSSLISDDDIFIASGDASFNKDKKKPGRKTYNKKPNFVSKVESTCPSSSSSSGTPTADEFCKHALDTHSCALNERVHKMVNNDSYTKGGDNRVWDLEDIITQANKHHACAYFASRALLENATVIFCPYSYLLDPRIQRSSGLSAILPSSVVMIDEAHNVENAARDCLSYTVDIGMLLSAVDWCYHCVDRNVHVSLHLSLAQITHCLISTLHNITSQNTILNPTYETISLLSSPLSSDVKHAFNGLTWVEIVAKSGLEAHSFEQIMKVCGVVIALHRESLSDTNDSAAAILDLSVDKSQKKRGNLSKQPNTTSDDSVINNAISSDSSTSSSNRVTGDWSLSDLWNDDSDKAKRLHSQQNNTFSQQQLYLHNSVLSCNANGLIGIQQTNLENTLQSAALISSSLSDHNQDLNDPASSLFMGSNHIQIKRLDKLNKSKQNKKPSKSTVERTHVPVPINMRMPPPFLFALETLYRSLASVLQETWVKRKVFSDDIDIDIDENNVNEVKPSPGASTLPSLSSSLSSSLVKTTYISNFEDDDDDDYKTLDIFRICDSDLNMYDNFSCTKGLSDNLLDNNPTDANDDAYIQLLLSEAEQRKGRPSKQSFISEFSCKMKNSEHYRVTLEKTHVAQSNKNPDKQDHAKECSFISVTNNIYGVNNSDPGLNKLAMLWNEFNSTTLNIICMSSSLSFLSLAKARSVVLTSATISPLSAIPCEVDQPFPITLQCKHVVSTNNVNAHIITHCNGIYGDQQHMFSNYKSLYNQALVTKLQQNDRITKTMFNSQFTSRKNINYVTSLGKSIASIAKHTPAGTLVFFPSRRFFEDCWNMWYDNGIVDELYLSNSVYIEPSSDGAPVYKGYVMGTNKSKTGALQQLHHTTLPHLVSFDNDLIPTSNLHKSEKNLCEPCKFDKKQFKDLLNSINHVVKNPNFYLSKFSKGLHDTTDDWDFYYSDYDISNEIIKLCTCNQPCNQPSSSISSFQFYMRSKSSAKPTADKQRNLTLSKSKASPNTMTAKKGKINLPWNKQLYKQKAAPEPSDINLLLKSYHDSNVLSEHVLFKRMLRCNPWIVMPQNIKDKYLPLLTLSNNKPDDYLILRGLLFKLFPSMRTYLTSPSEPPSIPSSKSGGIIFAICRGKLSEGVDLKDCDGRSVVLVGLPFQGARDTRVVLKKSYNDYMSQILAGNNNNNTSTHIDASTRITGDQWYSLDAYRTINQTMGRCIRHKQDFGNVFLFDERFNKPQNRGHLSSWVSDALVQGENMKKLTHELYHRNLHENMIPQPHNDHTNTDVSMYRKPKGSRASPRLAKVKSVFHPPQQRISNDYNASDSAQMSIASLSSFHSKMYWGLLESKLSK